MTSMLRRLATSRRGTTTLEYAMVFPLFIMFVFGMIMTYNLIQCRRAMDFGVEQALRYAVVHSSAGAAAVSTQYFASAGILSNQVGTSSTSSTVVITPSTTLTVGSTVKVTATYTWNAPSNFSTTTVATFPAVTMTATGTMQVLY